MYHKIYNGLFMPYEAILLKGHLDENEVCEALEDELGDKDQVEYSRMLCYNITWNRLEI